MSTSERQAVIERMQALIDRWEESDDPRAVFLSCYRMMTGNVLLAVEKGEFHDPAWVRELLQRFAGYYFDALAAYEQRGVQEAAPPVWKVAFDTTAANEAHALQVLMLGVNAHINYDLVLTLVDMLEPEWAGLPAAKRAQRYADHCHVNEVIGRTIDLVQDEVVEQASPRMDIVDKAFGPLDEWLTSRLLTHWREEVWRNALRWLSCAGDDEIEQLRREIEAATVRRADAILLHDGVLTLRHLV